MIDIIQGAAASMFKAAVKVLQQQGTAAIPSLLMALRNELPGVSRMAAIVLEEMAGQVPLTELLTVVQHPNGKIRANALDVLARKQQERVPLELLVAALGDPAWEVRATAARSLALWGSEAPIEPLIEAARDAHEMVRMLVEQTLCQVGQRQADMAISAVLYVLRQPIEDRDLRSGGGGGTHSF